MNAVHWCAREKHTGQRAFFQHITGWRDKSKWLHIAQQHRYYEEVSKPGLSRKRAALRFLELGIALAPTVGSPVCYQYGAVLTEPKCINGFFKADVMELETEHGEQVTVEEYRTRLVRAFARTPSTQEDKQTWAVYKTQYTQLKKVVARAKAGLEKQKAQDRAQGRAQDKPQRAKNNMGGGRPRDGRNPQAVVNSTLSDLATAALQLFPGDDHRVDVLGGASWNCIRQSRRRRVSLFGDSQFEASEEEVKALEDGRREGRTFNPRTVIAESRVGKWSTGVRKTSRGTQCEGTAC